MKKLVTLLLAVMMLLTLTVPALADGETPKIIISNATKDVEYDVYQMLEMENPDFVGQAFIYKAKGVWASFFATDEAKQYFAVDAEGRVSWAAGADASAAVVSAAADAALTWAKANDVDPTASKSAAAQGDTITFDENDGIGFGYYLVDSTVGVLCGLSATRPTAVVAAKNHMPTIQKWQNPRRNE